MCGFAVQRLSFQPCPTRAAEGGGPYGRVRNADVGRGPVPRRRASAKSGGPQVAALHRVRCGFAGVQRMDRGRAARVVEDADPYKGTRDPDIPVFAAKRFFPSGSDILHRPPRRLRPCRQLPRCISDRSMSASAGAGTADRRSLYS